VDWKTFLGTYDATVDYPAAYFYKDLMKAFPDAKVILAVRDPAKWYESAYHFLPPHLLSFISPLPSSERGKKGGRRKEGGGRSKEDGETRIDNDTIQHNLSEKETEGVSRKDFRRRRAFVPRDDRLDSVGWCLPRYIKIASPSSPSFNPPFSFPIKPLSQEDSRTKSTP
jgi:hypothetical protein